MSSSIANLSARQLRRAANIKDKIQSLENELGRILGASTKSSTAVTPVTGHFKTSQSGSNQNQPL
jgi:hypothetical protein